MHLLRRRKEDGGLELVTFETDERPPYAILSHTWVKGEEVSYSELRNGSGKHKSGYEKLQFCVDQAEKDGLEYSWVDTCCIDKSSSVEISTTINSMFSYYQQARKCYVYLADVDIGNVDGWCDGEVSAALKGSRWFTRGWTLQELLAPSEIDFYSRNARYLGTKTALKRHIHHITGIPIEALAGRALDRYSVEERLKWAAGRKTTIREDRVYCLLGILGIYMLPIYGEGEQHALSRLREELERSQARRRIGHRPTSWQRLQTAFLPISLLSIIACIITLGLALVGTIQNQSRTQQSLQRELENKSLAMNNKFHEWESRWLVMELRQFVRQTSLLIAESLSQFHRISQILQSTRAWNSRAEREEVLQIGARAWWNDAR